MGHIRVTIRGIVDGSGSTSISKFVTNYANVGLNFLEVGRAEKGGTGQDKVADGKEHRGMFTLSECMGKVDSAL